MKTQLGNLKKGIARIDLAIGLVILDYLLEMQDGLILDFLMVLADGFLFFGGCELGIQILSGKNFANVEVCLDLCHILLEYCLEIKH